MSAHAPILEVGHQKLFLLDASGGWEAELERDEHLRLTRSCIARVAALLGDRAKAQGWERGRAVWCAVGARGVSLRRLSLPANASDNLEAILALQIESEFPVPPSELAWGFMPLNSDGATAPRDVLVGAVKPEALQDLQDICDAAGLQPIFTLAALARSSLCPPSSPRSFAILNIESHQSELACFLDRAPESVRVIRWGWKDADRNLGAALQISLETALTELRSPSTSTTRREQLQLALISACAPLRNQLPAAALGEALFWSGDPSIDDDMAPFLAPGSAPDRRFERLPYAAAPGHTAATQGIQGWETRFRGIPLLQLRARGSHTPLSTRTPSPFKWGLVAALLLLGLLSLRYIEPLLGKGRLARRLEEVERQKSALPKLEQELGFLQYMQRNQPPFLEAVATLAQSASPGLRLDSLNMNRRGEISLRGTFANGPQAVDLRLKLIESGFFSSVVVEEQTPTPDRNQVIVRMTAQWKSPEERLAASLRRPPAPKGPSGGGATNASPVGSKPAVGGQAQPPPALHPKP